MNAIFLFLNMTENFSVFIFCKYISKNYANIRILLLRAEKMGKLRQFILEDVKKMNDFFHALGIVLKKLLKKQGKRNKIL